MGKFAAAVSMIHISETCSVVGDVINEALSTEEQTENTMTETY